MKSPIPMTATPAQGSGRAHPSDRAASLRPQPPAASSQSSIPCAAFTPGTWATDKFGEVVSLGKRGKSICMVLNDADGPANARLIATAPELYEALRRLLSHPNANLCECGEPHCATTIARAALAKAVGQ